MKPTVNILPATVADGNGVPIATKDVPQAIVLVVPSSFILNNNLSKLLGDPVIEILEIPVAKAVILTASYKSVLTAGVAELTILYTLGKILAVKVVAVALPNIGVWNVGVLENTKDPVPVSSVITPAN